MNVRKQGETVKLTFSSSDASGGAAMVVSDANGATRPIQSYERLILDSIEADIVTGITVDITDPSATTNSLLGSFSITAAGWATGGEGLSLAVGATPVATASGAGSVKIVATGRVINGKTRGFQAGFKSLLTPGGNVTGQ